MNYNTSSARALCTDRAWKRSGRKPRELLFRLISTWGICKVCKLLAEISRKNVSYENGKCCLLENVAYLNPSRHRRADHLVERRGEVEGALRPLRRRVAGPAATDRWRLKGANESLILIFEKESFPQWFRKFQISGNVAQDLAISLQICLEY